MGHPLKPHPMSPSGAVEAIEAEVTRSAGRLTVRYRLSGDIAGLIVPPPAVPARADELWRHTCFEAFVGRPGEGYDEFNLSPSGEWAAYRFDGYRQGMRPLGLAPPKITVSSTDEVLELTAVFDAVGEGRLGLAAVIEEAGGQVSYWALAHPAGKADFHHADCFALDLAASGRP